MADDTPDTPATPPATPPDAAARDWLADYRVVGTCPCCGAPVLLHKQAPEPTCPVGTGTFVLGNLCTYLCACRLTRALPPLAPASPLIGPGLPAAPQLPTLPYWQRDWQFPWTVTSEVGTGSVGLSDCADLPPPRWQDGPPACVTVLTPFLGGLTTTAAPAACASVYHSECQP